MKRPKRAATDIVVHEGTHVYRVILHDPTDDPTCFGLGMTPEGALRASLLGLFHHVSKCAGLDTAEAIRFVQRMTLN